MKKISTNLLLFALAAVLALAWLSRPGLNKKAKEHSPDLTANHTRRLQRPIKLLTKAITASAFVRKKNFNRRFCFLIDMSLPSNEKRFFVYDFQRDSILTSGLVAHGRCNQDWLTGRKYSNEPGCGCTALGRYYIGNSYYGRFGLAFKLHGLDKTNDKAFERFIVLHSHDCVPETETGQDICQSDGCPMVSPGFLEKLEPMIKGSKQSVLLWIFN